MALDPASAAAPNSSPCALLTHGAARRPRSTLRDEMMTEPPTMPFAELLGIRVTTSTPDLV
jgi:hypothetical protein